MSELAFNINGEPFELPPTMAAWRVRKLKPKGAPEVVYGRDGLPLFLPLDADIEDLRREARADGRYRLDPVDEQNRSVPSAQSSYVCVHPIERAPEPLAPVTPPAPVQVDATTALINALLESQKQHTELARMYVSQFPVLANAMAGVVRSAGDVGLTARVPLVLPALAEAKPAEGSDQDRESADDEEIDENEVGEEEAVEVAPAPEEYSWARVGQTFAEHVGPYVGPMLATSPSLAKLLGAHGRKPTTDATTPGPGPSDPAPAGGEASPASRPAAGLDAAMLVRLRQVMAQLSPDEEQFARSLIEEISPEDMASWIDRLRAMSIPEAVAYVRTMFRQAQAAAGDVASPARPVPAAAPATPTEPAAPTVPATPAAPTAPPRAGYAPSRSASSVSTASRRPTPDASPTRRHPAPANESARLRDAGTQAHLDQIEHALSADERAAMRRHFAALYPAERSLFVATLLMLPVPDAVAVVRGQIGAHPSTATPTSPPSEGTAPPSATTGLDEAPTERMAPPPARKRHRVSAVPHMPTREAPDDAATPSADPAAAAAPAELAASSSDPSDAPGPVARNAQTHLAEIESTLIPEELLVVHTLISELSPDDRDVWLDKLLSGSVTDGTAMLRTAIQSATKEPPTAKVSASAPRTESATAAVHAAATTAEPDARHAPTGDDELDDSDEPNDGDDVDDRDDLVAHDEPMTSAASRQRPAAPPTAATPATTALETAADLPTLDTDAVAHFAAIEDALTLAERMRANELAAQRPAAELRRWYAELVALSVPDAIAKIRAELARSEGDSPSTKKGGVS